jgi:hypothetical protein
MYFLTRSVWLFPAVVAFSFLYYTNLSICPRKKERGKSTISPGVLEPSLGHLRIAMLLDVQVPILIVF